MRKLRFLAVQNITKQTMRRIMQRRSPTTRETFQHLPVVMVLLMEARKNPEIKPPKCPQQSIDSPPAEVNTTVNTISMTEMHTSWHFRIGPIMFRPLQFSKIQPTVTPRSPYRQVEAPALKVSGAQRAVKMLPPIDEKMQMIMHLKEPKVYQNRERRIKVLTQFPKKCMKSMCNIAAVSSLHTCPLLIPQGQLAPISIRVELQISSSVPSLFRPRTASVMKIARYTNTMREVKDSHLQVGQHIIFIMSQQFSSLGALTFLLPDRNNTLCSSAACRCQAVSPSKPPQLPRNPP